MYNSREIAEKLQVHRVREPQSTII